MKRWEIKVLGDNITHKKGNAFKSNWFQSTGKPIVKVTNFTDNSIMNNNIEYVDDSIYNENLEYCIHTNDVIAQTVGSWPNNPASVVGKIIRVPKILNGALLNQNAVILRPKTGINSSFFYYLLKSDNFKGYIINTAQGAANQASITLDSIFRYKFYLPPLPIQRKIAAILSAYDDLIENNNRRIAILEKMAEGLYREWFVRLRFPGHEKVKIAKGVPEGWEVKRLGEIVSFLSGYSFKSETYLPSGKLGIVTIKNVQDGFFIPECSDYLDTTPSNMKDHCLLKFGDVLMSLTGNVGRICHVIGENYLLNQRVAKLSPKIQNATQFIYLTFKNHSMLQLIENLSLGSTAQMNLSPVELSKQKLITPEEPLLFNFEMATLPLNKEKLLLLEKNTFLKRIRDRLLSRLMSGKINVENLDIHFPASMQEKVTAGA